MYYGYGDKNKNKPMKNKILLAALFVVSATFAMAQTTPASTSSTTAKKQNTTTQVAPKKEITTNSVSRSPKESSQSSALQKKTANKTKINSGKNTHRKRGEKPKSAKKTSGFPNDSNTQAIPK
jgi:hypothetical protein